MREYERGTRSCMDGKGAASFVLVEILLPSTLTVTPASGAPPAVTFPVTTWPCIVVAGGCWAHRLAEAQNSKMQMDIILRPASRGTEEFLAVFTADSNKLLIMTSVV